MLLIKSLNEKWTNYQYPNPMKEISVTNNSAYSELLYIDIPV